MCGEREKKRERERERETYRIQIILSSVITYITANLQVEFLQAFHPQKPFEHPVNRIIVAILTIGGRG